MLKIDKNNKKLHMLEKISLTDCGITERYDLQAMIKNCPDLFFNEMGEELLLIGEEVKPAENIVDNRIDLLALDKEGNTVVIELKRGNNKLHLLQAISYAAMISDWEPERLLKQYEAFYGEQSDTNMLEDFVQEDFESINSSQRVLLVSEQYDYEVLVTAEWLTNFYGVDIKCFRLNISKEDESNEYLSCTCIFPPPEIADHVKTRARKRTSGGNYFGSWDEIYDTITVPGLIKFLRNEIENGRENYIKHKTIHFRINGKREFLIAARTNRLYVWQHNRFDEDIDFWKERLGEHVGIEEVKNGDSLRFFLYTEEDCNRYKNIFENELGEKYFV